jgi:hypothetical protein
MSNTPMTDTIVNLFNAMKNEQNQDEKYLVILRHARRLERERAELIAALKACADLLSNIAQNAHSIPDPRVEGAADVFAVPLDDIESIGGPLSQARALLEWWQ